MIRIRIEACDTDSGEFYGIDGESIPEVVVRCVTDLTSAEAGLLDLPVGMANLLETIGEAMRKSDRGEPPIARCWDFSSPEEAFYVAFFEDSGDDDGTDLATIWANDDKGLDKAVREFFQSGTEA